MARIITFGEILLRLAPEGYTRFVQADTFGATYGGSEANVAVSLSNFGQDAAFVTKLPEHEIGQAAINVLRQFGVDTSLIVRGGSRVGIYFLEKGASQRPGKVIYDRAGSAIATAKSGDFEWDKIFEGADWFHFSGIAPALGPNLVQLCMEACRVAKAMGLTVSCDLNYRRTLWTREEAGRCMEGLMEYVDVCIANEGQAADVFGIQAANNDVTSGKDSREGCEDVAKQLVDRFGFLNVAMTMRESISASDNNWAAMLYTDGKCYFSKEYAIRIVDRVGGGDSFAGGLIHAIVEGYGPQESIEFAVSASCIKHTIEGDINMVCVDEVNRLSGGDGSGRVQR